MKKIICIILAMLMTFSALPISAANNYEKALSRITPFKLLEEKSPDSPVTRGEAVQALIKILLKADLQNDGLVPPFADISVESPIAPYVNYAYTLGFLSGVDGMHFAPDSPITAQQFIKVAVSVLGYKIQADKEGGYPNGYLSVALRLKLLDGVKYTADKFTFEAAVRIIDNMMDAKTLEAVYDLDKYELSAESLYIQMLQRGELKAIKGIVTAVGKAAIKGYTALEKGEISVNGAVMEYPNADISMLGKYVIVAVREDNTTRLPFVESLYEENINEEIIIDAKDLTKLDVNEAVWYDDEKRNTEDIDFESPSVIYNERLLTPAQEAMIAIPSGGSVRALDNDGDKKYEVMFVEEYESFIVERTAAINHTVYFKDGKLFRSKTGITFDFEDDDKEYEIKNTKGEDIEFSEITENMVISLWANKAEDIVKAVVSSIQVEGTIDTKTDEEEVGIDGEMIELYSPIASEFLNKYALGQSGVFAQNHAGEIVGVAGEILKEGDYGYVIGFAPSNGISRNAQVKIVTSGKRERIVEINGDDETISYNYTNGEIKVFDFADKVTYVDAGGNETKGKADIIPAARFNRAVAFYKLNADGNIKHIELFAIPSYEAAITSYEYGFNAKITSFGASPYSGDPFYAGDTTQLLCIPIKAAPVEEDFEMDVTIEDESSYTVIPINIDSDTQIAESAVLISEMDSTKVKNFRDSDKICIIGKMKRVLNDDGGYDYSMEVLKGDKVELPYMTEGALKESIAQTLKKGDLIRYNTKSNGEIANLERLASISSLGNYYDTRTEVFAQVNDIVLDRLDGSRNVKVDIMEVELASTGRTTKFYVERDEDPVVYTYEKSSGIVRTGSTDEILGKLQVGDGASDVFIIIDESAPEVPKVIVNIIE